MLDELVAERDPPARLQLFPEPEQILPDLESVLKKMGVDPHASGRLEDPETTGERTDSFGEHDGVPESVPRRRSYIAEVFGARRIGAIDVDLLEARLVSRVVDDFDQVVFVFGGLKAQLDVALDRVGDEIVVGAKPDDRLKPADPADEVAHAFDD